MNSEQTVIEQIIPKKRYVGQRGKQTSHYKFQVLDTRTGISQYFLKGKDLKAGCGIAESTLYLMFQKGGTCVKWPHHQVYKVHIPVYEKVKRILK